MKRSVEDLTGRELRAWADEHLRYEWETLLYAGNMLGPEPKGMIDNIALESFLVHARCLNDFLWFPPPWGRPDDVFAIDFCDPKKWVQAREGLPQIYLASARQRKRWGGEIMHMTTRRMSGIRKDKAWPVGPISRELLQGLAKFGEVAQRGKITEELRSALLSLAPAAGSGLTIPLEYHGGTVRYPATGASELWAGGTWEPSEKHSTSGHTNRH